MLNLEYFGMSAGHHRYLPGNVASGISKYCIAYQEFFLKADGVDAGSIEPTTGQWIIGAAGGIACIRNYSLDSGAWGNANARVTLRVYSWNGTSFVAAENIAIGAEANQFTVRNPLDFKPCPPGYYGHGLEAKVALILVQTNTALCDWSGAIPNQTALIGIPLTAGSSILIRDTNDIKQFLAIDYTPSSASIIQAKLYF